MPASFLIVGPKQKKNLRLKNMLFTRLTELVNVLDLSAICENRFTAFFVTDNGQLLSKNALTYKDLSEEDCSRMCADNRVRIRLVLVYK